MHRVGRTGRAGKAGIASTFVIPREMEHLRAIERLTKRKIARRRAPSLGEVLEGQQKLAIQSLISLADENEVLAPFRASAEELLNDIDSVSLVAAAIKLLTKEPDQTPVSITEEAPLRVRRSRRRDGGPRDRRRDSRSRDRRRDSGDRRDRRHGERRNHDRNRSGERRDYRDRDNRDRQGERKQSTFKPYFKN